MGKSKRNKRNRDQRIAQTGLGRFLDSDLANANADVREAERILLGARQRAAHAAQQARTGSYSYREHFGQDGHTRTPVDLNDAGGRSPEDQAAAFFNRPGDYFLARFQITGGGDDMPVPGPTITFKAETVLKASEAEYPYLLEVLRQIRGGFGDRCRIELYRTHTVEREPEFNPTPTATNLAMRRLQAEHTRAVAEDRLAEAADRIIGSPVRPPSSIPDGPPMPMSDFTLGPRQRGPEVVGGDGRTDSERNGQIPPWLASLNVCDLCRRTGGEHEPTCVRRLEQAPDLTREELAEQLPGMTRAEAAAELGTTPEDLGGNIYGTGDMQVEQLAAEIGVPPGCLQPIPMAGGGVAYAVIPTPPEPEGRHASPGERPAMRGWCCGTPIGSPHVPGCDFEPRPDRPLDYDGPAEVRGTPS